MEKKNWYSLYFTGFGAKKWVFFSFFSHFFTFFRIPIIWEQNFICMWFKYLLRNVWRDFRLLIPAISNSDTKEFLRQIYCKKWCSYEYFYVTIADVDTRNLKSPKTFLTCWWDLSKIVWSEKYWATKMINNFRQSVGAILEDVWRPSLLLQCSKNYGSLTGNQVMSWSQHDRSETDFTWNAKLKSQFCSVCTGEAGMWTITVL